VLYIQRSSLDQQVLTNLRTITGDARISAVLDAVQASLPDGGPPATYLSERKVSFRKSRACRGR
jgi:hypothetical protein